MRRGTLIALTAGALVAAAGTLAAMRARAGRDDAVQVRLERVARRDLVSAVTASGTIEPKTSVDISADITGRITRIGVREGDDVRRGDFLLQIDPAQYQAAVARAEGVVASTQATVLQTKATRDQAERSRARARQLAELGPDLITREALEEAETGFDVAEANYRAAEAQLGQARAAVQEARDNLAKTRLVAPVSGRVVRVAVEEGEVAVPGTFSRETGLLMTIADLSVIVARVEVDETDVVHIAMRDSVEVAIDAFPDTVFLGRVTRVSQSAKLDPAGGTQGSDRAVDFDVEITLADPPEEARPDLSCTARIITAVRRGVLAVPILALTTREHEPVPSELAPEADTTRPRFRPPEAEGVFVARDGRVSFRAVKVGIAGEEHFEVLRGLREGEVVVAGPYQAIRDLRDGAAVEAADTAAREGVSTS